MNNMKNDEGILNENEDKKWTKEDEIR